MLGVRFDRTEPERFLVRVGLQVDYTVALPILPVVPFIHTPAVHSVNNAQAFFVHNDGWERNSGEQRIVNLGDVCTAD